MFHIFSQKYADYTIIYRSIVKPLIKMVVWKSLRKETPITDCNICLKIGDCYNTFKFVRYSSVGWCLRDNLKEYEPAKIPEEALYIALDLIPIKKYGL